MMNQTKTEHSYLQPDTMGKHLTEVVYAMLPTEVLAVRHQKIRYLRMNLRGKRAFGAVNLTQPSQATESGSSFTMKPLIGLPTDQARIRHDI